MVIMIKRDSGHSVGGCSNISCDGCGYDSAGSGSGDCDRVCNNVNGGDVTVADAKVAKPSLLRDRGAAIRMSVSDGHLVSYLPSLS